MSEGEVFGLEMVLIHYLFGNIYGSYATMRGS